VIESLRRDWTSFAWSWAFVAWYVLVGLTVDAFGYGRAFFWISTPLLFYCFYRGTQPWFQGSATYLQMAFWAMLFPFLLAIPLAAFWHAAAYVVRISNS
jgi:hypothetical protein